MILIISGLIDIFIVNYMVPSWALGIVCLLFGIVLLLLIKYSFETQLVFRDTNIKIYNSINEYLDINANTTIKEIKGGKTKWFTVINVKYEPKNLCL